MQKSGILAQSHPLIERLNRHRWAFGLLGGATALSMATAIAVAPNTSDAIRAQTVVETLVLDAAKPISGDGNSFMREERVQRGDTLGSLLARLGIDDPDASEFIRNNPQTQALHRQLAPGKTVVARTANNGQLQHLIFPLNAQDNALIVERRGSQFTASQQALRFENQIVMKSAEIQSSLFGATDAADIPDSIASQLAEIFGADIDFHRDLRKGDRFSVVYEIQYLRGIPARSGRILSAEFVNNGKTLRAVWFDQDGKGGYYTPEGKSLRKAFLRSPLEFSRVTSGFSMRFHPILQQWRAHKGVDYGAPSGTRVRSTGDGTVEFAGQQGGYGNLIIVRHGGNYATAYGHLRGFAPGLRKGSRISQGDTIGFVGQTGWATGPHLHYEFRIGGQQVNPLAISLPTAIPLDQAQMPRFSAISQSQMTQIAVARDLRPAAID